MSVVRRAWLSVALFLALNALCLFGAAGRFDIAEFWVYLALNTVAYVATLPMVDRELLAERMRPGGRAPPARLQSVTLLYIAHFLVAGYDRGRLHFAGGVPVGLEIAGFVAVAAMWIVMVWAMRANRFFSSVARLQADRGQVVISGGPYRVVRHPAYAMALLGCPGNGLALGSWLAAAIGALAIPMLLWRCIGEDRMLRTGLPGYADYAARVRWRLVPGIW